jgi:hypothetical protein
MHCCDGEEALTAMLETVARADHERPVLSIDIEGENLGREGTISMVQLCVQREDDTSHGYLIGVHKLGRAAFTTSVNVEGATWSLQSETIRKLMFDCRSDSDALFHLYGITLAGVIDCQLMDAATRYGAKHRKKLWSLQVAITMRMHKNFTYEVISAIQSGKQYGKLAMLTGHETAERVRLESNGVPEAAKKAIDEHHKLVAEAKLPGSTIVLPEVVDPFTCHRWCRHMRCRMCVSYPLYTTSIRITPSSMSLGRRVSMRRLGSGWRTQEALNSGLMAKAGRAI